jgi:hypothetical protein
MPQQSSPQNSSLLISYLSLRRATGIIGLALPFVLALGKIVFEGPGIQSSISAYYHTIMRDVLVGSLCAIGVFLMSYRGYERRDEIAGRLGCIFAIGVALIPTAPRLGATPLENILSAAHFWLAGLFFGTLAYFSIVLFTETAPGAKPTRQKLQRNVIYRVCGYTMLATVALIGFFTLPSVFPLVERFTPRFWLESLGIVAFGVSWLVKGETILKDQETPSAMRAAAAMN